MNCTADMSLGAICPPGGALEAETAFRLQAIGYGYVSELERG